MYDTLFLNKVKCNIIFSKTDILAETFKVYPYFRKTEHGITVTWNWNSPSISGKYCSRFYL